MRNQVQVGLLILSLTVLAVIGYNIYVRETTPPAMPYSQFLAELEQGRISSVHLQGGQISGEDSFERRFSTYAPDLPSLMPLLIHHQVEITAQAAAVNSVAGALRTLVPVILILGGWLIFNSRQAGKITGYGSNKTSRFTPVKGELVMLRDVAGIAEAKEELQDIVLYLKDPEKCSRLGGRIPRGVLLQGPPGTGKTMLAKAIAGEASVAFFSMGGSDFVEMFVGVGASRVRELFAEAKASAPCIIFIDEIDAIGGRRSGGLASGANDEREQTLNALLVEMDGFSSDQTVIMVAATNRPDILDPALLRPGRFDRQITVSLPDVKGRRKILEVHSRQVRIAKDLDLAEIARSIPGFSGAEIANLVNEAALGAARRETNAVEMSDFEEAKDKLIMGLERKNVVISEQDRRITAYHEAGHAIVGLMLEETDPLHKITIIPRGRAMGITQQLPLDDRHTYSLEYLQNRIKILLGGRAAESQVFNRLTTGASSDIVTATEIATRIVCDWGMSDAVGPVAYRQFVEMPGAEAAAVPCSEATRERVDSEIRLIIDNCFDEACQLLKLHNRFLHKFAEILLVHETMDAEEVDIVYRSYLKERHLENNLIQEHKGGRRESSSLSAAGTGGASMKNICRTIVLAVGIIVAGSILRPWLGMAMEAEDAPQEVVLEQLQQFYEPVVFDHGMHVDLAECSACHHHTTGGLAATTNCGRCHQGGQEADSVACTDCHPVQRFHSSYLQSLQDPMLYHIDKPGLKGAYHLGCLGCHRQNDGPVGCQDCHAITEEGRSLYRSAQVAAAPDGDSEHRKN